MSEKARRGWYGALAIFTRFLASDNFFYGTLTLFILQALWFAFTAKYPMAFDENYHFGLIKLHAQQWLPFFTHQPPNAGIYGSVVRDPSYLYHYLMSFPYRLISLITANQIAQVITLRILNIAMAAGSFVLFRKLLGRLGASRALSHTVLILFCLIPIVPFLAAHINYDNLFILFTVLGLLVAFDWLDDLAANHLSVIRMAGLTWILLAGSLVKYPFLPIAVELGAMGLWQLWKRRAHLPALWHSFMSDARRQPIWLLTALTVGTLIISGLFAERYVVNLVKYHSPSPDCSKVLDVNTCLQYSPWARNYTFAQQMPSGDSPSKTAYPLQWVEGMWQRSFFAISDTYETGSPLPIPGGTSAVIGFVGALLFLWYFRRILRGNVYRQTALLVLAGYTLALFIQTFEGYMETGVPIAVNGRYLVPFMPIMFLFIGLAFRESWRHHALVKPVAALVVILLLLQGGGVMTFIVESDESWDWPNPAVVHVNNVARKVLSPAIVGARKH